MGVFSRQLHEESSNCIRKCSVYFPCMCGPKWSLNPVKQVTSKAIEQTYCSPALFQHWTSCISTVAALICRLSHAGRSVRLSLCAQQ